MFKLNNFRRLLFIALIFIAYKTIRVAAWDDDDEDDIIGEIIVDMIVGAGMAVCEQYATCRLMMTIITLASLVFVCVGMCVGFIDKSDVCNKRTVRRGLTTGGGYYAARGILR